MPGQKQFRVSCDKCGHSSIVDKFAEAEPPKEVTTTVRESRFSNITHRFRCSSCGVKGAVSIEELFGPQSADSNQKQSPFESYTLEEVRMELEAIVAAIMQVPADQKGKLANIVLGN